MLSIIFLLSPSIFGADDTNGIWIKASDVRGGSFGSDELDVTSNFIFAVPTYFLDKVGIGTQIPTEKLEVVGVTKTQELKWGNAGILRKDQGASIELGGIGKSYIDFSNDVTSDFDARIILDSDSKLSIYGTELNVDNTIRAKNFYQNNKNLDSIYLNTQGDTVQNYFKVEGTLTTKRLCLKDTLGTTRCISKWSEIGPYLVTVVN